MGVADSASESTRNLRRGKAFGERGTGEGEEGFARVEDPAAQSPFLCGRLGMARSERVIDAHFR